MKRKVPSHESQSSPSLIRQTQRLGHTCANIHRSTHIYGNTKTHADRTWRHGVRKDLSPFLCCPNPLCGCVFCLCARSESQCSLRLTDRSACDVGSIAQAICDPKPRPLMPPEAGAVLLLSSGWRCWAAVGRNSTAWAWAPTGTEERTLPYCLTSICAVIPLIASFSPLSLPPLHRPLSSATSPPTLSPAACSLSPQLSSSLWDESIRQLRLVLPHVGIISEGALCAAVKRHSWLKERLMNNIYVLWDAAQASHHDLKSLQSVWTQHCWRIHSAAHITALISLYFIVVWMLKILLHSAV